MWDGKPTKNYVGCIQSVKNLNAYPIIEYFFGNWDIKIATLTVGVACNLAYFETTSRAHNRVPDQVMSEDENENLPELIRNSKLMTECVQFLIFHNKITEMFMYKFFLDPTLKEMKYLKEFICFCENVQVVDLLLSTLNYENLHIIRENHNRLRWFGMYFTQANDFTPAHQYIKKKHDYIALTLTHYFYLHVTHSDRVNSYKGTIVTE